MTKLDHCEEKDYNLGGGREQILVPQPARNRGSNGVLTKFPNIFIQLSLHEEKRKSSPNAPYLLAMFHMFAKVRML